MATLIPRIFLLVALLATLTFIGACGGGQDSGSASTPATAEPAAAAAPPEKHAAAPGPRGTASVTGTVRFEGEVPPLKAVKMDADPGCAAKHDTAPQSELLVLGDDQAMANVFVRVSSGLVGSYPPPADPAVIDQDGCRYDPHVLGVQRGQTLKILNSDGLLHNVHALPSVNKTFNMAMPASRTEAEVTFTETEEMFKIKCDVHPWMGAWVRVMEHPFFDVTGMDGGFVIENLPAGSYEIEAWHERLGTQTLTAEVTDGQQVELAFTMTK